MKIFLTFPMLLMEWRGYMSGVSQTTKADPVILELYWSFVLPPPFSGQNPRQNKAEWEGLTYPNPNRYRRLSGTGHWPLWHKCCNILPGWGAILRCINVSEPHCQGRVFCKMTSKSILKTNNLFSLVLWTLCFNKRYIIRLVIFL